MHAILNHGTQSSKWMELRAKTDRQLIMIVNRLLAQGVRSAIRAAETGAPELHAEASRAYHQTQQLAAYLGDIEISERWRVERELNRLRLLLDRTEMSPAHAGAACG